MLFSIVTPSFRNSDWLKLCIASVADQQGVAVEHIVQDSCSDDGTQDWLRDDRRVIACIEKDNGMYDAINRGFKRSKGDILAYLNCDEQYLPGALKAVHDFFEQNPDVDAVVADTVIVDRKGEYICHRYSLVPLRDHLWVRFNVPTCSLFIQRRVVDQLGLYFDPQWRALGDAFWLTEAVRRGVRFAELRTFTSAFTETGVNLGLGPDAIRETQMRCEMMPRMVKITKPLIILHHRLRMLASGAFFQKPFEYSLYTLADPMRRSTLRAKHPTPLWVGRR